MSSVIYLNVPDQVKEKVKELGAQWNPFNQSWYIDEEEENIDKDAFYKWLPHNDKFKEEE